jgi:mannitol-1-phosphate/altronate dehydrogenase
VIVNSITSFVHVPFDGITNDLYDAVIISLTVTEKGYYCTTSGGLDTGHELIASDVEDFNTDDYKPKTALGLICGVMRNHLANRTPPPTVMSCDNLPMNGDYTRKMVLEFARCVDGVSASAGGAPTPTPSLSSFIQQHVKFPNSMVDRITPATTPEVTSALEAAHGVVDQWPVVAEPFLQWVIEDSFTGHRPDYDSVPDLPGVIFTPNVEPYEYMKLRLLNSSHSALSYISLLLDHTHVHSAMADVDINKFVVKYMNELVPTLDEVPGVDIQQYCSDLVNRFSNAEIADTLLRLAADGSKKFYSTLPKALEKIKHHDTPPAAICFAFSSYLKYCSVSETLDDPESNNLITFSKSRSIRQFISLFIDADDVIDWLLPGLQSALKEIEDKGARCALIDLITK